MDRRPGLIGSGVALGVMLAASAWAWTRLPADASIAVHWGLDGTADRFGGKAEGLLLMPAVGAAVALLLAVVPAVEPRSRHLARSQTAYTVTWVATMAFLAVVHLVTVANALGSEVPVTSVVLAALGVLLALIGIAIGRIRSTYSTYTFGIRTPWTLDSEHAWERTHRVAGPLFVALGAATLVAALATTPRVSTIVLLAGLAAVLVITTAVSFLTWRDDPARGGGS